MMQEFVSVVEFNLYKESVDRRLGQLVEKTNKNSERINEIDRSYVSTSEKISQILEKLDELNDKLDGKLRTSKQKTNELEEKVNELIMKPAKDADESRKVIRTTIISSVVSFVIGAILAWVASVV